MDAQEDELRAREAIARAREVRREERERRRRAHEAALAGINARLEALRGAPRASPGRPPKSALKPGTAKSTKSSSPAEDAGIGPKTTVGASARRFAAAEARQAKGGAKRRSPPRRSPPRTRRAASAAQDSALPGTPRRGGAAPKGRPGKSKRPLFPDEGGIDAEPVESSAGAIDAQLATRPQVEFVGAPVGKGTKVPSGFWPWPTELMTRSRTKTI